MGWKIKLPKAPSLAKVAKVLAPPAPAKVVDVFRHPTVAKVKEVLKPPSVAAIKSLKPVLSVTNVSFKPPSPLKAVAKSKPPFVSDTVFNFLAAPIRSTIVADPLMSWIQTGKLGSYHNRTKAGVHELYKEDRVAQRLGVKESSIVTVVEVVGICVAIYFSCGFASSALAGVGGSAGAGAGAAGAGVGATGAGVGIGGAVLAVASDLAVGAVGTAVTVGVNKEMNKGADGMEAVAGVAQEPQPFSIPKWVPGLAFAALAIYLGAR